MHFLCILVTNDFAHADLAHADFYQTKKMYEPMQFVTAEFKCLFNIIWLNAEFFSQLKFFANYTWYLNWVSRGIPMCSWLSSRGTSQPWACFNCCCRHSGLLTVYSKQQQPLQQRALPLKPPRHPAAHSAVTAALRLCRPAAVCRRVPGTKSGVDVRQ